MHVLEVDLETVLLGFDVWQDKALIMYEHDVFAQFGQIVQDALAILSHEAFSAHVYIAGQVGVIIAPDHSHAFE